MDQKIKFNEIGGCIAVMTCFFVIIIWASTFICPCLWYQDDDEEDEENVIYEERGRTEAEVRNYNDGIPVEKDHYFHKQIYWQWYEDGTVLSSPNANHVPSIS